MIAKSIAVSLGSNYIHLLFSIDVSGPLAHIASANTSQRADAVC